MEKQIKNQMLFGESSECCFAREANVLLKHKYFRGEQSIHSKAFNIFEDNYYVYVSITYHDLLEPKEQYIMQAVYNKEEGKWSW